MKGMISVFLLMLSGLSIFSQAKLMNTLYDFKSMTIEGKEFDFANLKSKKVLIVNTASECGYTPQYAQLEELYKEFGPDKFTIIGFPANNFGAQEPGTDSEIKQFCTKNYGVTFQMMAKISVIGDDIDPLYSWLTSKELNGMQDAPVKWNFQKFLIDEKGHWAFVVSYKESPISEQIIDWITN